LRCTLCRRLRLSFAIATTMKPHPRWSCCWFSHCSDRTSNRTRGLHLPSSRTCSRCKRPWSRCGATADQTELQQTRPRHQRRWPASPTSRTGIRDGSGGSRERPVEATQVRHRLSTSVWRLSIRLPLAASL